VRITDRQREPVRVVSHQGNSPGPGGRNRKGIGDKEKIVVEVVFTKEARKRRR